MSWLADFARNDPCGRRRLGGHAPSTTALSALWGHCGNTTVHRVIGLHYQLRPSLTFNTGEGIFSRATECSLLNTELQPKSRSLNHRAEWSSAASALLAKARPDWGGCQHTDVGNNNSDSHTRWLYGRMYTYTANLCTQSAL